MPDVLTQSQIDELLQNLSSGETSFPKNSATESAAKNYDFKSPKKLTKEQIKTLMGVYEVLARHLASYLSGILRVYCEISVASIEELPYYEYNNSLPDSVLIGIMEAKPIEGNILVDLSNNISFTLIDRSLGGAGTGAAPSREFTEIEVTLMDRIFRQIAVFSKEAWSGFLDVQTDFKQIETNARLIQSMAMDEIVIIVVMDVSIGPVKGTINFCIPCINLETIIDQLNRNRYNTKRMTDSEQENIVKNTMINHVNDSTLEVEGIFGQTVLTMREVLSLQVGDVICLDQSVDKHVMLNIGGRTWFYGTPGIKRNKKAVKISKVL